MHLKDLGNLSVFIKLLNDIGSNSDAIDFFNKVDLATQKIIVSSGKLNTVQLEAIKTNAKWIDGTDGIRTTLHGLSEKELDAAIKTATHSAAQKEATATTGGLGTAYKGLATSIGVSTTALTVMLGALVAVSVGAIAIQKYNQHVKDQNDNARETAQAIAEQNKSLDDNISKLKELRSKLDDSNTSESEAYDIKEQLYEIQKSLIESYGDEAEGLRLVNGEIDTQIDKLKTLSKEKAIAWQRDNQDAINRANEVMTKEQPLFVGGEYNLDRETYQEQIDAIQKAVTKYMADGLSIDLTSDANNHGALSYEISFTGDATNAKKVLDDFSADIQNLSTEFGDGNNLILKNLVGTSAEQLKQQSKIIEENLSTYVTNLQADIAQAQNIDFDGKSYNPNKVYGDYLSAIDNYNKALSTGDGIKEAKKEYESLLPIINEIIKKNEDFAYLFNDENSGLNTTLVDRQSYVDNFDVSSFYKQRADLLKGLQDVDLETSNMTDEQKQAFDWLTEAAGLYNLSLEDTVDVLKELGIVSGNTADAATELPKAFSKSEMIAAINATTDGFESLDKIMSSMKDKNPFNYALLDDKNFKDTFGGLEESYENFVEKISNSPKDVKGCQSAFDDLLTTWLNSTDIISGLSDETAQLTIDMLSNMGVANAQEVVVAALAQRHAEAAWSSRDLTNATAEEITALANESEATDDARTSFETYIVQKMLAEAAIDTTGDISALANVVNALGLATGAWQKYYAAKSRMAEIAADPNYVGREENGDIVSKETVLSQYAALAGTYQKEYAEDLEKMAKEKASYGGGVKTSKSGSGGGSKGSKSKEATEFDTAAESIKNLRAQLDSLNTILENTDPYSQKLDTLKLIIAKQKEYNDALKSQSDVYQAEYQKALSALPQQWQDNITGDKNFSIDEVPASLKDAVNRAQDFKDKWTSVNQSILQANRELEDTKQKVYDLAQTKLDNKIGLIENKISDVQNKMDEADAMGLQATKKQYKNMISLSKQEASIYQDKLQGLMAVMAAMEAAGATDTDNYYKTAEAIQSCEDAISKCAQSQAKWNKAMLELPIQYLERANDELNDQLDGLKEEQNRLDGAINGVTAHLQNQIDVQQKLRDEAEKAADEKIDAINKEKDALQEVNEKRKQQLDLEQKQYDLERAKNQKTTKVFKEESGDFVYEADQSAIRDAQDSYDEALFNKQISDLDDKIKDIEDARDELLNSYDEEIDRLQKIMDSWNDITDAIQRAKDMAMANSILGSGWEDRVTSGDTSDIGNITGKYEQNDKQQSWVEEQIEANERLIREVERYVEAWQMGEMSIREARESINDIVGDIAPEIEANDERVNSLSSYQAQWSNANQTVNSDIAAINAATTNNVEELTATEQRRAAAQLYADQWATNVLTVGDSLNSITTANSDATLAEGQFLDTRITKLTSFQSSYATMASNIAARCREIVQACREAERAMDRLEKKESKGGYAKGTENAKPGFHEVAEGNKPEIIVKNDGSALLAKRETLYPFEGGETVLNAGDTKDILSRENFKPLSMSQLMAFTNSDDSAMMKSAIPDNVIRKNEIISVSRTEKQENVEIKINNLNLPRVKDPDSFAKGMYDGSFRSAVQQKKYSRK